jgi:hypothetical protein
MAENTFTVVFQKLAEAEAEVAASAILVYPGASVQEMEEIAELRRVVLEITDPYPMSYTST